MKKAALATLALILNGTCGATAASVDNAGARVEFELVASGKSCPSHGSAIAISDNFFITAAHVVQVMPGQMKPCGLEEAVENKTKIDNKSYVLINGSKKKFVKMWGSPYEFDISGVKYPGGLDLGYISTAKRARDISDELAISVCDEMPSIGSTVRFVADGIAANVRLIDPKTEKNNEQAYFAISEVLPGGSSGGGIFDVNKNCLLGVISHQWPGNKPEMTRFTRVTKIEVAELIRRAKASY